MSPTVPAIPEHLETFHDGAFGWRYCPVGVTGPDVETTVDGARYETRALAAVAAQEAYPELAQWDCDPQVDIIVASPLPPWVADDDVVAPGGDA